MVGAGVPLLLLLAAPPARAPAASRPPAERPRYTGERISVNLKDADLRDVILHLAELSGLNVALHADVRGTVTLSLEDVPCDQALELVLRLNGLGSTREGRTLLAGPPEKLLAQERASPSPGR